MDSSALRQRVVRNLLTSPWGIVPAVSGLGLLTSGAMASSVEMMFWGVVSIAAAAGAIATRWLLAGDKIIETEFRALQSQAKQQEQQSLDALDRRLQSDRDPTTEQALRQLRRLYETFHSTDSWSKAVDTRTSFDISRRVEELFTACLQSLERSLELWQGAQRMLTPSGREKLLARRAELLQEVQQSVQQLALTIDNVQALAIGQRTGQNLGKLRSELDHSLQVAQKVEQRMRSLEEDLNQSDLETRYE